MTTNGTRKSWLTTAELAELLGIDSSSLRRWRTAQPPQGPPFVKLSSRRTIYSRHDVETWLASQRIDPGSAA